MKRNSLWFTCLVVLLALQACGPAVGPAAPVPTSAPATEEPALATLTPEPVDLKVAAFALISHAPVFVASAEGYFAEQGLNVEPLVFTAGQTEIFTALLQGEADAMAFTLSTAHLSAMAQGSPIKIVADINYLDPNAECANSAWLARTDWLENGTLSGPAAVPGMKMAFATGTTLELGAERLLEAGGLTAADVEFTEFRNSAAMIEALRAGQLDALPATEPFVTRALAGGGIGIWVPYSELMPNYSNTFILFGPSMLARDPQVGARFMTAILKALRQLQQGKTERNVEIISEYTQMTPEEVRQICLPSLRADGKVNTDGIMEFQEWAVSKGYLDAVVPLETLWDPQYLEQAAEVLGP